MDVKCKRGTSLLAQHEGRLHGLGRCRYWACLAIICQFRNRKAMNCGLDCRCVCGWHKLEALQGLYLQLPFLCYALYNLCCKRSISKAYEPLLLQEDVHHNLCRFPACCLL